MFGDHVEAFPTCGPPPSLMLKGFQHFLFGNRLHFEMLKMIFQHLLQRDSQTKSFNIVDAFQHLPQREPQTKCSTFPL